MENSNLKNNNNLNSKKQELLKTEILDKNLDKDLFLEFCIKKKENGDDLDNWNLDELQQTILEYKNLDAENKIKSSKDKKKKIIYKEIDEDDKLNDVDVQQLKYGVNNVLFF